MGQYEVKASLVSVWLGEWEQAVRERGIHLSPAAMRAATEVPSSNPYCPFTNAEVREGAVVTMTAYGAQEFCRWVTLRTGHYYRLPTEAEWEYACRAGTETAYFFGPDRGKLAEYAWFEGRDGSLLRGQTAPNPWGLYNMYGNVGEYVLDGWSEDYKAEAAAASTRPIVRDPWRAHRDRDYAVVRGGDYRSLPAELRSAARTRVLQSQDVNNNGAIFSCRRGDGDMEATGFRIVRPLRREGDGRERCIPAPDYK